MQEHMRAPLVLSVLPALLKAECMTEGPAYHGIPSLSTRIPSFWYESSGVRPLIGDRLGIDGKTITGYFLFSK